MDSTDRQEFDSLMRKLCAGIGIPPTDERLAAFWSGLARMKIPQFSRVVDFMLSEHGPDVKSITVHMIWDIHKDMRRQPGGLLGAPSDAAPVKAVGSVQEQLCEYAALQLGSRLSRAEFARPWTYRYREWWVDKTRCAEVIGIEISRDDGTTMKFSAADMLADTEGHARALRRFAHASREPRAVSEPRSLRLKPLSAPLLEPAERIAIREVFSELSPPPPQWDDMPEFMR